MSIATFIGVIAFRENGESINRAPDMMVVNSGIKFQSSFFSQLNMLRPLNRTAFARQF